MDSHPSYRMGSTPSQRAPLEDRVPPTLASEATGWWGAQLARVSPLGSGLGSLSVAEVRITLHVHFLKNKVISLKTEKLPCCTEDNEFRTQFLKNNLMDLLFTSIMHDSSTRQTAYLLHSYQMQKCASSLQSLIVAFSLPSPTVESQPLGLRLMPRQLTAATEGLYCRG